MYVACSGRCVKHEVVELTPVGIGDELLQCVRCHAATPQSCGIGVYEEADREQLDAVLLDWFYEVATVFLHGVGACVLHLEHLRN